MATPLCMTDTNPDRNEYSSPIPLIGLYVAGATSVCLLLMLVDAISGIRRKNLYIPCRFFSLNSATLTLIGVASKLPVDLTTYMPSARDQLSKLTGTTMVCICIGFFMPSLGANIESESIANMIALSLVVTTIFVNICIQMSTGVIFSFMAEHIVILCCMLTLSFMLWCSILGNRHIKSYIARENKNAFRSNKRSRLIDGLRLWYISSRTFNPQLIFCNDYFGVVVDIVCILCLVVVSQAAFRSLILDKFEFCKGISDYGWSMWMIIITQIVTIIIGGLAIGFRWLALILLNTRIYHDIDIRDFLEAQLAVLKRRFLNVVHGILGSEVDDFSIQFSLMKTRSVNKFIVRTSQVSLKFGLLVLFILNFFIIAFVPLCLSIISMAFITHCCPSNSETNEVDSMISWIEEMQCTMYLYKESKWMARQCVKDMNKWTNRKKRESTNDYMVHMLSTHGPSSDEALLNDCKGIAWKLGRNRYKAVTCLSMVFLVKILSVSIPLDLTKTLRHTLDEAFEIIYFIDERLNVKDDDDQRRCELAKLLWTSGDIDTSKMDMKDHPFGSVDYVISVVEGLYIKSKDVFLRVELMIVREFIKARNCTMVEDLRDYSEQLFAAMLRSFLAQLPSAIFKEFNLSPLERCEKKAEAIIKLLCGLEASLENKVQWVFPEDANVICFFDLEDHNANIQNSTIKEGGDATASNDVVSSTSRDVEMGSS